MNGAFVLITAAKNEEQFIGRTIASVTGQTLLPIRWVIVDDGSTDLTASVVEQSMQMHSFVVLLRRQSDGSRSFGAKSRAVEAAWRSVAALDFDFVAIVDADTSIERTDCFAEMVALFDTRPGLGILGANVQELHGNEWKSRKGNRSNAVAGALQLFRRDCFEACGGYKPLCYGGEDWLVQLDASMHGWEIDVSQDQPILHHRPTSSAGGRWRGFFRCGLMDASFGSHPLFEACKCMRRILERPYVAGAAVRYAGYLWSHLRGERPVIPPTSRAFLRQQQRAKAKHWVRTLFDA